MVVLNKVAGPIQRYVEYQKNVRRLVPESAQKQGAHLTKVEAALGKPLIHARAGSEIEAAIYSAAEGRKQKWNGGHLDDGSGMRFRLGMAVCCFLRWAYRERLIDRNPYEENTFRRPHKMNAGFLPNERLEYLFRCDRLMITDQVLIRFLIDTGLRVSELCRVTMRDLDFEERTVSVYATKVDRPRVVAFSEVTKYWLSIYLAVRGHETPFLFCNYDGGQLSTNAVRVRMRKISQIIGFRIHPHMLRHTSGTLAIQEAEQVIVMRYLGHEDPAMTAHYIHLTGKDARRLQDKVYAARPFLRGFGGLDPVQKN